ncbi:sensor histidine kinase [uncultured Sulfitobacter sp.]|uniref:sensor histidine kinase n=1 Tax=uncultured Sulfitobacter sp. TaxID=191468 RepID=UPI0030F79069
MPDIEESKLRFKPKARIIRTIGDQLISGPEAAVIELVKNAYDADANFVEIRFSPPLQPGQGRISISDDGHGMSLDDIRLKWMEPATASKVKNRRSPTKNRKMMGSKGIGRFAAAKLGAKMALTSTVQTKEGNAAVLIPELDWSIFSDDVYLSDIAIDYLVQAVEEPTGTTIEVIELHEEWTKERLTKLYNELRRLLSPFSASHENGEEFSVYLDLSDCDSGSAGFDPEEIFAQAGPDLSDGPYSGQGRRVHPFPLLSTCDYELSGSLAADGSFEGSFVIHRAGRGAETITIPGTGIKRSESAGDVEVQLYLFDREADALKSNMKAAGMGDLSATEARRLLDSISGVAIYREGFRVRPYGDPENDWLALDSRRVQDPSLRIGHNQIAGYLKIGSEQDSNLFERSSREGLEDNAAFQNLARLTKRLLAEVVEPKRFDFREKAGISRPRSSSFDELKELSELKRIRKLISLLEPKQREQAERIIDTESQRLSMRVDAMRERQRVLEAQSSLGAILAEVLHEGSPEATFVRKSADRMNVMLKTFLTGDDNGKSKAREFFSERIPQMKASGEKLSELFRVLRPLAGGKRRQPTLFYPIKTIKDALAIFEGHQVEVEIETTAKGMEFLGHAEDLSTAMVNIVGNAVHWFEATGIEEPCIQITLSRSDDGGHVFIEDNGPGVREEFMERIFEVGFTLKDGGTGLGLNIAREALARSGGKLKFHPEHKDGALFEIEFPVGPKH